MDANCGNKKRSIDSLGPDQWKWLSKYENIKLGEWRMELIDEWSDQPDWYYVGDWKPGSQENARDERRDNLGAIGTITGPTQRDPDKWNPMLGSMESWRELWEKRCRGQEINLANVSELCTTTWFRDKTKPIVGGRERRQEFIEDLLHYITVHQTHDASGENLAAGLLKCTINDDS